MLNRRQADIGKQNQYLREICQEFFICMYLLKTHLAVNNVRGIQWVLPSTSSYRVSNWSAKL